MPHAGGEGLNPEAARLIALYRGRGARIARRNGARANMLARIGAAACGLP